MWAEWLLALGAGLGLSAAAGFRVFVPLLVAGLAVRSGHLEVAEDMQWLATDPALLALGIATLVEVAAAHIPWVDHLLDGLALPAATVAGAVLASAFVVDVDPWLRWTLVAISGGGLAGGVHLAMATVRIGSTSMTAGLANPVVAAVETGLSLAMTLLVIAVPLLMAAAVAAALVVGLPWVVSRAAAWAT